MTLLAIFNQRIWFWNPDLGESRNLLTWLVDILHVFIRALLPPRLEVQDHQIVVVMGQHIAEVLSETEIKNFTLPYGFYSVDELDFLDILLVLGHNYVLPTSNEEHIRTVHPLNLLGLLDIRSLDGCDYFNRNRALKNRE